MLGQSLFGGSGGGVQQNERRDFQGIQQEQAEGMEGTYLNVSGVVEWGQLEVEDNLLIKYEVCMGDGWTVSDGHTQGVSQKSYPHYQHDQRMVWNLPLDFVLQGKKLLGWPQLVVVLYGFDFLGRSVVKAYGSLHLPTQAGTHHRTCHLFSPLPDSLFSQTVKYIFGTQKEITHPSQLLAQNESRENLKTQSAGHLQVQFRVGIMTK